MSGAAAKQSPGAGSATDPAAAEKAVAGDSVPVPEPAPPPLLSVDVTGLVSQFARSFVLIFPVYVLGYLGLSFSWVLIALCGLFWIRRHRGGKTSRLGRALAFLEDEEEAVRLSVSSADLPAWVSGQHPSPLPREHPRPAGASQLPGCCVPPTPARPPLPRAAGEEARYRPEPRSRPVAGREGVRTWYLPRPAARPGLPASPRPGVRRRERRCRTWAGRVGPPVRRGGVSPRPARPPRRSRLVR